MECTQNKDQFATPTAVAETRKGPLATLLGQFATGEFWKNLLSLVLKEAVSAFILSLGGTLIYYIKGKAGNDSNSIRNITGVGSNNNATSSPATAFANGYQPRPAYQPTYPAAATNSAPTYPAFGS